MSRAIELLQLVLDTHTSRKNAMSHGIGPQCDCSDCNAIRRAIELIEKRHPA
jgi:hypothetical protein